jgi:hypothetical protein
MWRGKRKQVADVFGVSNVVLPDSYVDRGDLDGQIARLLARPNHVALRGASKSGKSWLRQNLLPGAIVIQCRLGKSILDIYKEALGELDIRLEVSLSQSSSFNGTVEAAGEAGHSLLTKVMAKFGFTTGLSDSVTTESLSQSITDLRFMRT